MKSLKIAPQHIGALVSLCEHIASGITPKGLTLNANHPGLKVITDLLKTNVANDVPLVLEWSNTLLNGEAVTYEKAEAAVKALGPGWRLPHRHELAALVDVSRYSPAIDIKKFPDTQSSYYWTDTPWAGNPTSGVWVVGFNHGDVNGFHRDLGCCVRAVRELPSGQ